MLINNVVVRFFSALHVVIEDETHFLLSHTTTLTYMNPTTNQKPKAGIFHGHTSFSSTVRSLKSESTGNTESQPLAQAPIWLNWFLLSQYMYYWPKDIPHTDTSSIKFLCVSASIQWNLLCRPPVLNHLATMPCITVITVMSTIAKQHRCYLFPVAIMHIQ